jgi:hypothetical protein
LLVRSIQRFKPLLTPLQEARLAASLDEESDPGVRAGLASIIEALKQPAASRRPSGQPRPAAPAVVPAPPRPAPAQSGVN